MYIYHINSNICTLECFNINYKIVAVTILNIGIKNYMQNIKQFMLL